MRKWYKNLGAKRLWDQDQAFPCKACAALSLPSHERQVARPRWAWSWWCDAILRLNAWGNERHVPFQASHGLILRRLQIGPPKAGAYRLGDACIFAGI